MVSDKEIKKEILEKARKEPEKWYPAGLLREMGFSRHVCKFCGRGFWSQEEREFCDEPECRMKGGLEPYGFIGTGRPMTYEEAWEAWKRIFSERGHAVIPRYPVVARWRDDVFFVQASIYDFQPHVVSGEVEPPANPLLVPQVCLRFNDVENVGLSGRHYTSFVMVGQHAFNYPDKWIYFKDRGLWYIMELLEKGLRLDGIFFHEDAWAGGGNFGVSMEFFYRGLEIGNQVYMEFQMTEAGPKELPIKVIDMGAGLERHPWAVSGRPTSYEIVFSHSFRKISKSLGLEYDEDAWLKLGRYLGILNVDEMELEKAWQEIARMTGMDKEEVKSKIGDVSAMFAVLDHFRTLWFGINDGALPSNVGGGYNLRYVFRRALNILKRKGWNISPGEIVDALRKDVKGMFPELVESEELVKDVLETEKRKYEKVLEKGRRVVMKVLQKDRITFQDLKMLYESHGILPEIVEEMAPPGKEIEKGFYSRMAEERKEKKEVRKVVDVSGFPETEKLFYEDNSCEANVLGSVKAEKGYWVVFDRTVFYPEMGGQEPDRGWVEWDGKRAEVIDVQKVGGVIIHLMKEVPAGRVRMEIDWERRKRLMQHHTATHIVGLASRRVFGKHIYQAGTHKYPDRAYLDVSHYRDITEDEIRKIERIANEVVGMDVPVKVEILPRTEAEMKYGMKIYQGGAPPGRELRIVSILEDHQACGGTHVSSTSQVERIIITSVSKIQDSRYRIEFVAGEAAKEFEAKVRHLLGELEGIDREWQSIQERWKQKRKEWEECLKRVAEGFGEVEVKHLPISSKDLDLLGRMVRSRRAVVVAKDLGFMVIDRDGKAREIAEMLHKLFGGKSGGTETFVRGRLEKFDSGMLGELHGRVENA